MAKKKLDETEIPFDDNETEIPFENPELETNIGKLQNYESRPFKVAKFVRIAGSEIIIEVDGNGERIPYIKSEHSSLKPGDEVRFRR